jgi:hypothetical protein
MLIGTAKPMPTLPSSPEPPVSICELMPRTAGVAGVDRRVGLQDVVDLKTVGGFDLALQGRYDTGRERSFEVERVADREHRIADFDGGGVTEGQRMHADAFAWHLQDRQVVRGVLADHLRFNRLFVFEADRDLDRVLDHVIIRQDRAVGVDQDPGAGRRTLLFAAFATEGER